MAIELDLLALACLMLLAICLRVIPYLDLLGLGMVLIPLRRRSSLSPVGAAVSVPAVWLLGVVSDAASYPVFSATPASSFVPPHNCVFHFVYCICFQPHQVLAFGCCFWLLLLAVACGMSQPLRSVILGLALSYLWCHLFLTCLAIVSNRLPNFTWNCRETCPVVSDRIRWIPLLWAGDGPR